MNKALEFVKEKCQGEDIFDFLDNQKVIYTEQYNEHRWWDEILVVVNIDDYFIGFLSATTTGDSSPNDLGWEFDENSVRFCESYVVSKTRFKRIG
jgi:hypothetical protein